MKAEERIVSCAVLISHYRREYANLELDIKRLERSIRAGGTHSKKKKGNLTSWKSGVKDLRAEQAEIMACVEDLLREMDEDVRVLAASRGKDWREAALGQHRVGLGGFDDSRHHGNFRRIG